MEFDAVVGWGDTGVGKMLEAVADSPPRSSRLPFDADMIAELEGRGEIVVLAMHGEQQMDTKPQFQRQRSIRSASPRRQHGRDAGIPQGVVVALISPTAQCKLRRNGPRPSAGSGQWVAWRSAQREAHQITSIRCRAEFDAALPTALPGCSRRKSQGADS